ncbi:MAG: hypothetical protein ACJ0GV_02130 [Dehalococcoidia bacterium]
MLEKEKKLIIEKIQNSDIDICVNISGCGFQFLNNILKISGASKFLLNAEIPYSKLILEKFYKIKSPYVTEENAKKLSLTSLNKFIKVKNNNILVSVGCIGTIKTYYDKKGSEKIYIYIISSNKKEYSFEMNFKKDSNISREGQDEKINILILTLLNNFIDNNYEIEIGENKFKYLISSSDAIVNIKEKVINE